MSNASAECASIYAELKHIRDAIGGESVVSYSELQADASLAPCTCSLTQADFNGGTVFLNVSNVLYQLTENIEFNPNEGSDFLPTAPQRAPGGLYADARFGHGFFAAMCVEVDEVHIDLNGFRFQASVKFALQQRFYSHVEVANTFFEAGFGPFPTVPLVPVSNFFISNGVFGRSSHHHVHGNRPSNVMIENVGCENWEVAAISFNGGNNILIKNVSLSGTRSDIPVNASYSQSRLIRSVMTSIISRDPTASLAFASGSRTGTQLLDALNVVLDAAFANVVAGEAVDANGNTAGSYLKSASGVPDAISYGVVLNRTGVAVLGFDLTQPADRAEARNENVCLWNVSVNGVKSEEQEIVALNDPNGSPGTYPSATVQKGPLGGIFRVDLLQDSSGFYKSTVLSNCKLFVQQHAQPSEVGTSSIHPAIVTWALSGSHTLGASALTAAMASVSPPLYFVFQADSMAHVIKGSIGLFLQSAKNLNLYEVCVDGVSQTGSAGGGNYSTFSLPDASSSLPGYQGTTARGAAIVSCEGVDITNLTLKNVSSSVSNAIGLDYIGVNTSVAQENLSVDSLSCPAVDTTANIGPNKIAECSAVRVRSSQLKQQMFTTGCCPFQHLKP